MMNASDSWTIFISENMQISNQEHWNGMNKDTNLMEVFEFKIGSRVMLVKNLDISDSLVNGARGNVIGVKEDKGLFWVPEKTIGPPIAL